MHNKHHNNSRAVTIRSCARRRVTAGFAGVAAAAAAALMTAAPHPAFAQSATISGSAGNFDVVNDTGQDACGYEMDLEGVSDSSSVYTFDYTRYGPATKSSYANGALSGTRVTWKSSDCSTVRTPSMPKGSSVAACWSSPVQYDSCDHFGIGLNYSAIPPGLQSSFKGRWLVRDPARPGAYIASGVDAAVPNPYQYVSNVNGTPVVVDVIVVPPAPEPTRFGEATWMKVFRSQMTRAVTLDELLTTNPLIVPLNAAQLEFDWKLMQADPDGGGNRQRGRSEGGSSLKASTRAVVKRYETYAYTGTLDPVTNEALCVNVGCATPGAGEVGDFLSAQMTAVNVQGDFITVKKSGTGGGNVESADKKVSCGSKCEAPFFAGSAVALTVKPDSGSTFGGWTGACSGTASTCSVVVNGENVVGAVFNKVVTGGGGGGGGGGGSTSYTLSIGRSNNGTVTSAPPGINCGSTCAAKFTSGTAVALTAVPPAGKSFVGWSGACSGTASTCSVTIKADTKVQANFSK